MFDLFDETAIFVSASRFSRSLITSLSVKKKDSSSLI